MIYKKFLTVIAAAILALSLTGCGKDSGKSSAPTQNAASSTDKISSDSSSGTADAPSAADAPSQADSSADIPDASDITSAAESADNPDTADDASSEAPDPDKPQTVETRIFKRRPLDEFDTEDIFINVEILDNGGWSMSSNTWAGQTYADYSFEEEAAGAYVQIVGYSAGAEPNFVGTARFIMTEETLTVLYEGDDEGIIYDRYRI